MANKSSFMLAALLIANPFMMLFFQDCSSTLNASTRTPASVSKIKVVKVKSLNSDENKESKQKE